MQLANKCMACTDHIHSLIDSSILSVAALCTGDGSGEERRQKGWIQTVSCHFSFRLSQKRIHDLIPDSNRSEYVLQLGDEVRMSSSCTARSSP